jgi:triosephosphate isomerase
MFFTNKPYTIRQSDPGRPFIVLNLKTYNESTGSNALRLALIAEKVQKDTGINIIVCCQAIDFKDLTSKVKIPVFAQHVDYAPIGKSTGKIVPEHALSINIRGSLINHSENRVSLKDIEKAVTKLKELDMTSIVCAKDYVEAKKIAGFKLIKPNFIAVEPPELIGGEISVSQSKPDIIGKSVKVCGTVPVLVGAGIKNNDDVKTAIRYGAKGVLLASHFVLAKDPEKFLRELVKDI